LALAKRLAQETVIRDPVIERQAERATVRQLSLPHGNADEISDLLADDGFSEAPGELVSEWPS
jgi:hypothetical protein